MVSDSCCKPYIALIVWTAGLMTILQVMKLDLRSWHGCICVIVRMVGCNSSYAGLLATSAMLPAQFLEGFHFIVASPGHTCTIIHCWISSLICLSGGWITLAKVKCSPKHILVNVCVPLCHLPLNIRFQYFTNDNILLDITFYTLHHLVGKRVVYSIQVSLCTLCKLHLLLFIQSPEWHNVLLWENETKPRGLAPH